MGLDVQSLRLLLLARRMGVAFGRTVTLGRQDLLLTPVQIGQVMHSFGLAINEQDAQRIAFGRDRFSEPMFEKLGASIVDSIDASTYEGATIIHDLNEAMPAELGESYDLVFDGGTLEHIFDFPTALRNCLGLPKLGGHFIMASPGNNQMGHGFYQFSPDLFFRIFSAENGYQLKGLFLVPSFSEGQWYKIKDPAVVGARVGYNAGARAFSIFAIAQRTRLTALLTSRIQQSDYRVEWEQMPGKGANPSRLSFFDRSVDTGAAAPRFLKQVFRALVPSFALDSWRALRLGKRCQLPPDPRHFEPISVP